MTTAAERLPQVPMYRGSRKHVLDWTDQPRFLPANSVKTVRKGELETLAQEVVVDLLVSIAGPEHHETRLKLIRATRATPDP